MARKWLEGEWLVVGRRTGPGAMGWSVNSAFDTEAEATAKADALNQSTAHLNSNPMTAQEYGVITRDEGKKIERIKIVLQHGEVFSK